VNIWEYMGDDGPAECCRQLQSRQRPGYSSIRSSVDSQHVDRTDKIEDPIEVQNVFPGRRAASSVATGVRMLAATVGVETDPR